MEDVEDANVEADIGDSALNDSSVIGSKRVRDVELIDLGALPPGDDLTSAKQGANAAPQAYRLQTPPNKKFRLSVENSISQDWIAPHSDHKRRFSLSPRESRIPHPSSQSSILSRPNKYDVDPADCPPYLYTLPSPSMILQHPPSSPPSSPSISPFPASHSSSSTDPSSCGTPPKFQEHTSLRSHPSFRRPAHDGIAPLVCSLPTGDEEMMFLTFMEAIERDKIKASNTHAMQVWHQASYPGAPDHLPFDGHPPEAGADWLQVLSQNAHLVNLKSGTSSPGFGSSDVTHGPSMFYKPAKLFDVKGSPECHQPLPLSLLFESLG